MVLPGIVKDERLEREITILAKIVA